MATIFTSILNTLHWVKYNFTLAAGYHHKDIYDDNFENRGNSYVFAGEYAQKWEKAQLVFNQCITKDLSTIDLTVYNSKGEVHFTAPMNVVSNPAVQLPYVLNTYWLNMSAYPDDYYQCVMSSGSGENLVRLRISEWIELKADQPGTLLAKYGHSTNNKFNTYMTDQIPFRFEAALLDWYDDDSHEGYTNEIADVELLDGIPLQKRILETKFVPDWVRRKLIYILMLNRCYIEGTRYSRTPENKIGMKKVVGSNLVSYRIEISKAVNSYGLGTDETGTEDQLVITYTLNAQAFGSGNPGDVINMEVINN